MITHIDIEAETCNVRLSCLIDHEKKDPITGKYKVVMPALLFFKTRKDMDCSTVEYDSIDNPLYIFGEFKEFLERFLLNKISIEDRKEFEYILNVITTYEQAREVLSMIEWIEDYGVESDY